MHKHRHHRDKTPVLTSLDKLEELYVSQDAPINPTNGFKKPSKPSEGYKFYMKIREHLAEWWEEFNGELDHDGRLKHITVRSFIKTKTKKGPEINYLYQMIGPYCKREESEVPWLGDWDKRRRNGFGVLDNPEKMKPLIKMIKNNMAAAESIKSLTPVLVEELVQYDYLQKQVHEAFAGRAFGRGEANHKKNKERFESYKLMLWSLSELKIKIVGEIMRVHGVDPKLPQQMRDMAQIAGSVGAAAALTGLAAGQIAGVRSTDGTMIAPYTYDSIKLAEHLSRHAHTFNKPLPSKVIDAIEVEEEDASSSSSKANGRPQ